MASRPQPGPGPASLPGAANRQAQPGPAAALDQGAAGTKAEAADRRPGPDEPNRRRSRAQHSSRPGGQPAAVSGARPGRHRRSQGSEQGYFQQVFVSAGLGTAKPGTSDPGPLDPGAAGLGWGGHIRLDGQRKTPGWSSARPGLGTAGRDAGRRGLPRGGRGGGGDGGPSSCSAGARRPGARRVVPGPAGLRPAADTRGPATTWPRCQAPWPRTFIKPWSEPAGHPGTGFADRSAGLPEFMDPPTDPAGARRLGRPGGHGWSPGPGQRADGRAEPHGNSVSGSCATAGGAIAAIVVAAVIGLGVYSRWLSGQTGSPVPDTQPRRVPGRDRGSRPGPGTPSGPAPEPADREHRRRAGRRRPGRQPQPEPAAREAQPGHQRHAHDVPDAPGRGRPQAASHPPARQRPGPGARQGYPGRIRSRRPRWARRRASPSPRRTAGS